jgi:hypothetical protein
MSSLTFRLGPLLVALSPWLSQTLAFQIHSSPQVSSQAVQGSGSRRALPILTPQSVTPIGISSCQTIASAGDYTLLQDLTSGSSCIVITNISNVNLECFGHAVFSTGSAPNIVVINSTSIAIHGCTAHKSSENGYGLQVVRSSSVNIANNDIESVDIETSNSVQVVSNHILGAYYQNATTGAVIENNDVVAYSDIGGCGGICSVFGDHNQFLANHVDGQWNGQTPTGSQGADDGISFNTEHDDVVLGNVILNVFDAGIETAGLIRNTVIQNNQIQNAGLTGIGAYYDTGWINNTVSANQVSQAFVGIYVFFASYPGVPNPATIAFQNNLIENNVFTSPRQLLGTTSYDYSVRITLVDPATGLSVVPVVAGNNIIANNSLPTFQPGPLVLPNPPFVDGGGNHCGQPPTGSPVSCNGAPAQSLGPFITSTRMPRAEIGIGYISTLTGSGGTPPYSGWAITGGSLPAGLTLNTATGVISGTPTGTAAFPLTSYFVQLTTTDNDGRVSAPQPLTISVSPRATTSQIIPGKLGIFRSVGTLGLWVRDLIGSGTYSPNDPLSWFGLAGDYPVVGDWNGTGVQSIGVFRNGVWYLDLNNNGQWDGVAGGDGIFYFGLPGDIPVVGDWTGTGVSRFGVFRCSPGQVCTWILDANGSKAYEPSDPVYYYGLYGDLPVVNNWSGVGNEDQIGVYRPMPNGLAIWIVDSNGSGAWEPSDAIYQFGLASDLPVVGNWYIGNRKRIGVYRGGTWVLDTNGNNAFDATDGVSFFGLPGDKPAVGNWFF